MTENPLPQLENGSEKRPSSLREIGEAVAPIAFIGGIYFAIDGAYKGNVFEVIAGLAATISQAEQTIKIVNMFRHPRTPRE